jgi:hypothetical protein
MLEATPPSNNAPIVTPAPEPTALIETVSSAVATPIAEVKVIAPEF